MLVPRFWVRSDVLPARGGSRWNPRGWRLQTWGWSNDSAALARAHAQQRLAQLAQRVLSQAPLHADAYYGQDERPLREEIVSFAALADSAQAVITRNRYGALVLNAAQLLVIDVDFPPPPPRPGLLSWLRRPPADDGEVTAFERLRTALRAQGGFFRIYRTRAGLRALGLDRPFAPTAEDTLRLMQQAGADPLFVRLCQSQNSFRARLTPKPWRCDMPLPASRFPRESDDSAARHAKWCRDYARRSAGYAVCRPLEEVGHGTVDKSLRPLIDLHDQLSGTASNRPLA
jgi:hypothetical protein